jgi:Protein of unknown function (DUF3037)
LGKSLKFRKTGATSIPAGTRIGLPMPDLLRIEFLLLQYTPNAFTDDAINIGVLVIGEGVMDVRFRKDWDVVSRLDPDVDLEMLDAIRWDLEMKFHSTKREEMLETIERSFSNTIRCSGRGQLLCEDPATGVDTLVLRYL